MDIKSYLRGLIEIDPTEYPFGRMFRNFWKGVLDLIRNLVVIAFLQFVAEKSQSIAIKILFEISILALVGYLMAFGALSFNVFRPVRDPILRERLNFAVYLVVSIFVYALMRSGIKIVVADIATAQALR